MRLLLASIVATVLASCSFYNVGSYQIASSERGDEQEVKTILKSIAAKNDLVDTTPKSLAKDTIVFYLEPRVDHWPVRLGARKIEKNIQIDVLAGYGPRIPKYEKVRSELEHQMKEEFGERFLEASATGQ